MPFQEDPTLFVPAGPNGAGKSTFYETRIAPKTSFPFVNADVIQRDELRSADMNAAYEAAKIAEGRRAAFPEQGESFVVESVFSHPSKVEFILRAKDLGHRIVTFHVCVATPRPSAARVAGRVDEGGHPVPENRIHERYARSGPLIRKAVPLSDVGRVHDSTSCSEPPKCVVKFEKGRPVLADERLPRWVRDIYAEELGSRSMPR